VPHKGREILVMHNMTFMVDAVGTFACTIVPGMRRPSEPSTAVGDRYGGENGASEGSWTHV
jgi:hypothetical protein